MRSLSGLGFGLSIVFGVLLLAFIAEAYYLIFLRKKKTVNQLFSWKKPTLFPYHRDNHHRRRAGHPENSGADPEADFLHEQDPELGLTKDFIFKAFGEESIEAELMRLHNLAGPPRFLFTINEETMEDLESEDGKSIKGDYKIQKGRSLSHDFVLGIEKSPVFSPLRSPPLKASPLSLESYGQRGSFNPLFESTAEAEFNKFKSSPPPKFKFLRDAEEKLLRRLMDEGSKNSIMADIDVREGSFLTFLVGKHRDVQILPLASSPTTEFRPKETSVVN